MAASPFEPMREPRIGKVVVNIATGKSGEPLDRAMTILEQLTGQKPCMRQARRTLRAFGIRKNEPIACVVTLRRDRAAEFLKRALDAKGNRVAGRSFDDRGNFAFGIREHIDIPGAKYDPTLGIVGMDVMVSVERPGYRVQRRRRKRAKVGHAQRMTRDETVEFIRKQFRTEVET